MQKSRFLLLATTLFVGLVVFAPVPAQASWCQICAGSPDDCFACCKCQGYSHSICSVRCGPGLAGASFGPEPTLDLVSSANVCSVNACGAAEALSTEETQVTEAAQATEVAPAPEASK